MVTPVSKEEQRIGGGLRSVLNFWDMSIKTGLKQTAALLCNVVVHLLQLQLQCCNKAFGLSMYTVCVLLVCVFSSEGLETVGSCDSFCVLSSFSLVLSLPRGNDPKT